jgi:hypothetical protein
MADDVYRFATADGQTHAWHGPIGALQQAHPGAVVTGHLVMDEVSQGSWEPVSDTPGAPAAKKGATAEAPAESDAEADEKPAKKNGK